jgi:gas vesicle protein
MTLSQPPPSLNFCRKYPIHKNIGKGFKKALVSFIGWGATSLGAAVCFLESLHKGDIRELKTELKGDIRELKTELKGDIRELKTELKEDIRELKTELKEDIRELKTELKGDIRELKTELKGDITELKTDMNRLMEDVAFIKGALTNKK